MATGSGRKGEDIARVSGPSVGHPGASQAEFSRPMWANPKGRSVMPDYTMDDYNGYKIVKPDPVGEGGIALNDNFKKVADDIAALQAAAAPGGADGQVQFNDDGAFGGDAGMTFDKAADLLTVLGGVG